MRCLLTVEAALAHNFVTEALMMSPGLVKRVSQVNSRMFKDHANPSRFDTREVRKNVRLISTASSFPLVSPEAQTQAVY
jgi:hypothetical protein